MQQSKSLLIIGHVSGAEGKVLPFATTRLTCRAWAVCCSYWKMLDSRKDKITTHLPLTSHYSSFFSISTLLGKADILIFVKFLIIYIKILAV
jgi:hypothetical protein